MNTQLSQILTLCFLTFGLASAAQAADTGDQSCQVFIASAQKIDSGTYGSFVTAGIAVKKELVQSKGTAAQVAIHYKDATGNWKDESARFIDERDGFFYYDVQFSYGALDSTAPAEMTAFVGDHQNRLFDNNNQAGNVLLNTGNEFKYQSHCVL